MYVLSVLRVLGVLRILGVLRVLGGTFHDAADCVLALAQVLADRVADRAQRQPRRVELVQRLDREDVPKSSATRATRTARPRHAAVPTATSRSSRVRRHVPWFAAAAAAPVRRDERSSGMNGAVLSDAAQRDGMPRARQHTTGMAMPLWSHAAMHPCSAAARGQERTRSGPTGPAGLVSQGGRCEWSRTS